MNKVKILFSVLFLLPFWVTGQNFVLQDSIKLNVPDSYAFFQADAFNSLYFVSQKENTLLKYSWIDGKEFVLKNFTPSRKLFIVNPFFLVIWDKITKNLEFYDDKLVSTQDKVPILQDKIINPNLVYVQDNRLLTYFDEFTTESFIQKDYRSDKNIVFSNALPKDYFSGYLHKEIYVSKQSRFLLSKRINLPDSLVNNEYRVTLQNAKEKLVSYDIPRLDYSSWSERSFFWIDGEDVYLYDFENEPKKIKLPQKGEDYCIFNQQLFLWKSQVMYLYKLELEN